MLRIATLMISFSSLAFAQQSSTPAPSSVDSNQSKITVRGCLRSERSNYILIENKTGSVYALQGVGNKLQGFLRKQVEVTGETKPGNVKTGIRPEKSGSNPADTVHGVDGVPLQVNDVDKDIHVISKHCKAADQQ
jgi:hypothetical protein